MEMAVPITLGSLPAVDPQVSCPRLQNWYVGESGCYRLPRLVRLASLPEVIALHKTTYERGSYLVVSQHSLHRVNERGDVERIGAISIASGLARMAENQQHQVTIVDGVNVYVFDQQQKRMRRLSCELVNPVDVEVLNTFTIIVGGTDKRWVVSKANDALHYDRSVTLSDEGMGNLTGVKQLSNNLFIFGQRGIQRWLPSVERTVYDFPFSQDGSFRQGYGCVATGSLVGQTDAIYFLASNDKVMCLSSSAGLVEISKAGLARLLASYGPVRMLRGGVFNWEGDYFYQLSFVGHVEPGGLMPAWVYHCATHRWSESDECLLGADQEAVVAKQDGLYRLATMGEAKSCVLVTDVIAPRNAAMGRRSVLNAVALWVVQGQLQLREPQFVELSLSFDNVSWSNSVKQPLGLTGKRQAILLWRLNVSATQFVLRFRYDGPIIFSLKSLSVSVN